MGMWCGRIRIGVLPPAAEPVHHLFVNPASMPNSHNAENVPSRINAIDNAQSPHSIFPEPLQLLYEWLSGMRIYGQRSGSLNGVSHLFSL